MTRVDFRKAFRGEALRKRQSPTVPLQASAATMSAVPASPVWRRALRAPFALVRRFLVGALHGKIDHLTVMTAEMASQVARQTAEMASQVARLQNLEALTADRFHALDIKVRGPHEFDGDTDAIRLNDGYVLVPKRARKLRLLLADAPPDGLEPGTAQVLRRLLSKGMTAIDVGANVGALSLVCARAVGPTGKVHAFEPEPLFAGLLCEAFDLNGTPWVEVHRKAVGRENGQATFHVSPIGGHSSMYPLPEAEAEQQADIQVEVGRLDDIFASGSRIDLVKMDVEGAELDVLSGMHRLIGDNPDLAIVAEYGRSHLRGQGLDPKYWADQFASLGYAMFEVDELSGKCEPTTAAMFGEKYSVNIAMARVGTRAYDLLAASR
jgi:FkbM family methyltransferase